MANSSVHAVVATPADGCVYAGLMHSFMRLTMAAANGRLELVNWLQKLTKTRIMVKGKVWGGLVAESLCRV